MNTLTSTQKRNKILNLAKTQLGETENPANSNRTKFGKWYGFDGFPWCAMYVSWVYHHAGFPLGKIDDAKGFRGCQSGFNHWKSTRELTTQPTKGDIVLFSWGGSTANHVGIFIEWLNASKTKFRSIEGNTSFADQRNGGQVMIRERNIENVKAFVKPKVLLGNSTPANIDSIDILKKGDKGVAVTDIQKKLSDLGFAITIDGDFGPKTEKTVKEFQKKHQLTQTGIVTPSLKGLIEDELAKDKEVPDHELITGVFLKQGSIGAAVKDLQKLLNKKGIQPTLVEDGDFGAKTKNNVAAFQKKSKITADGIVGPQTWSYLLK